MTWRLRWAALEPRERRVILGAALLIGSALIVTRALPVWNDWVDTTANRRAVLVDSLARMRAITSDAARDRARSRSSRLALEVGRAGVLTARSEELAVTRLLGLISAAADDVGVTLSTAQGQPLVARSARSKQRQRAAFSTVSVRATGNADPDLLPELLAFIDTSRTQLSTRSFSVTAGVLSAETRTSGVQFDLVVSALVRIDAGSPTRSPR
jgi:type II secretory pathway component PulM